MINEEHWFQLWNYDSTRTWMVSEEEVGELLWLGMITPVDEKSFHTERYGLVTVNHYAYIDPDVELTSAGMV